MMDHHRLLFEDFVEFKPGTEITFLISCMPHLHFALYWSGKSDMVSIGFEFLGEDSVPYRSVAGNFHNTSGPCAK